MSDEKWKKHFIKCVKCLKLLEEITKLQKERPLSDIERTAMIKNFEMCYEASLKLLRSYLKEQGVEGKIELADAIREVSERGWITDEKIWQKIKERRNEAVHVYHEKIALELDKEIAEFYSAFEAMASHFDKIYKQGN